MHDSEQAVADLQEAVRVRQAVDAPDGAARSEEELIALEDGVISASPLLRDAVGASLARTARGDLNEVMASDDMQDMLRGIEMATRFSPEKMAVARTLAKRLKGTMVRLRRALAGFAGEANALGAAYTEAHPRPDSQSGESLADEIRNELALQGWYTGGVEDIYLELIADIQSQEQPPKA